MRFEIEVALDSKIYHYDLAFELPTNFKELRVLEETLRVEGRPVYSRKNAEVHLAGEGRHKEADFRIEWHLVALPIIQQASATDPLALFRQWTRPHSEEYRFSR